MRYVITQLYFGFDHEIEISEDDFNALQEARSMILLLSSFEEKFMLVLENYEELEQEMIALSLHRMIFEDRSNPTFIDNLRLLNRRFANLLTTCRLYKDHSAHHVSTIYGKDSKQFKDYAQLHSKYYEQNAGYRTMEAARNFLQHRSLIISGITYKIDREKEENHESHLAVINLNTHRLREEGGFKSTILLELETIATDKGNVDIRPLVREYISSLVEIHLELRKLFEDVATKFDTMILDTINRLNSLANENNDSVYVVAYKGENEISKEVPLLRDFIERRHRIVNKTRYIKLHSTSYVISK
jgi:hypothetical protein